MSGARMVGEPRQATNLFVVVSGIPASGKTTLAKKLASALSLPVIDKDDILEGLFAQHATIDESLRARLSRQSDEIMRETARSLPAAILVSFWQNPDRSESSGAPSAWLRELPGRVVEIYCKCAADVARERFMTRTRHPGHNDVAAVARLLPQFDAVAKRYPLKVGQHIQVEVNDELDIDMLMAKILGTV
jgi:cytidylate kinase